jgi:hypothetical protein
MYYLIVKKSTNHVICYGDRAEDDRPDNGIYIREIQMNPKASDRNEMVFSKIDDLELREVETLPPDPLPYKYFHTVEGGFKLDPEFIKIVNPVYDIVEIYKRLREYDQMFADILGIGGNV